MRRAIVTYAKEEKAAPYMDAARAAGLEPLLVASQTNVTFDGLMLTGGVDLNPVLYGEAPHAEAEDPDDHRDRLELDLLRLALERGVPVLAICRGLQLLNVFQGGTLDQHIAAYRKHQRYDIPAQEPVHSIEVKAGSHLARAVGAGIVAVNSRHHQAVKELGRGLVVSARDEDGLIEAFEIPGACFAVAVQWHPEDQAPHDPVQARLFRAFAEACEAATP